ncbi:DEAD/DEAH box helicase [Pollutibacter soli]|uniref:DEAD/DEAH box helicase n=1 Tax=Pollutibacter soli TaxID=3034157 RepID=UPI003013BE5C
MAFNLLSEPIRKYVYDKRWEKLRPIQAAAITKILSRDGNFILASKTASGKTEAAFLPILSKVDFSEKGVQVLYISPLIALINDQFQRIEELCKYLDVTVTKWHGEANKTLKGRITKSPEGIVLITPESLEAMFVNKAFNIKHLFSNLKYIVIDEIHSFLGTDRGIQLKSILFRLQIVNPIPFNIIGLSATIGDYIEAKRFTGDEENTKVLLDKTAREINAVFRYFDHTGDELPIKLIDDLYQETKDNKVLIFPNSRGKVEEIAVKLKKISQKVNGHSNYFAHHSSIDREVREEVEHFAKNNNRQSFSIVCTSTLELGIDIGTVDEVVQIDATFSIASLIQRVGRSGRRDGEISKLFLYATNQWSLLQSLACWQLYTEGFIEPPLSTEKPFDILAHQLLSIVKGRSGISQQELEQLLKTNFAFSKVESSEIKEILIYLIETNRLEKIGSEVIIGVDGERIVNNRDFYSVFKSEENFKVVSNRNPIGEIPFSPQIRIDENILLAARIWKIKDVDEKAKRIEVVPANDGKKPMFSGSGGNIHSRIRLKMLEILFSEQQFDILNEECNNQLSLLRSDFSAFKIVNTSLERPLIVHNNHIEFFSFIGTRVNRTISLLLEISGLSNTVNEKDCECAIHIQSDKHEFLQTWSGLTNLIPNVEAHIFDLLDKNPALLDFSKWGGLLPKKYQVSLLKQKYFDLNETEAFIKKVKFNFPK